MVTGVFPGWAVFTSCSGHCVQDANGNITNSTSELKITTGVSGRAALVIHNPGEAANERVLATRHLSE
jgi:hypothetical protein